MEKTLWQWNICPSLIATMEKAWFYERFFFKMVIVMLKDKKKKKNIIKDTMSVKINFTDYMKWIRVILPVAF